MSDSSQTTENDQTEASEPVKPAARVENARKIYGKDEATVKALDGVSLEFPKATFTAVMGPSGSGKSTLMHVAAGLDRLTSGEAYIGDYAISSLKEKELTKLRREKVGFIFQAFNLIPTLNAQENITLVDALAGKTPDKDWFNEIVERVKIADRLQHKPSELSGGQQQRVAVARALVSRPEIVFADEPTGNLDSNSGHEVLELLRQAVDQWGQTIVMVTHDAGAARWADQVLWLADGQAAGVDTNPSVDSILDHMKHLEN